MRYTKKPEHNVTFYPHGALQPYDDQQAGQPAEVVEDTQLQDFLPRNLAGLHSTDPLNYNIAKLDKSEGFRPLELTDYCTSIVYTHSIKGVYGSAEIVIELPFADSLKLLGGVPIGGDRHLRSDNDALTIRNLCTGGWLVIQQQSRGVFFGQVTAVRTQMRVLPNGSPVRSTLISADNFYVAFMRNQLKQTLSRDDSIAEIEPSAIFQAGDYSTGFLSSIRESFNEQSPAATLRSVIKALGTYKLPACLTQKSDATLGDYIKVVDGSATEMLEYGMKGADADVIKGKIMTLFQGAFSNNITHHETISQMFNVAPNLFEMFSVFVPLTDDMEVSDNVYQTIGGIPVLVYRYQPVYPYAPPTTQGIDKVRLLNFNTLDTYVEATDCEKFFGSMPTYDYGEGQSYVMDAQYLTDLTLSVDESARINCTFVEGAFSNAQGHTLNFFRTNAAPTVNKTDINRHGLRAYSMHTPFISLKDDPVAVRNFNERAPNALAERLFHNIGMGHTFYTGSFTIEYSGEVPYIKDSPELTYVPAGNWISFQLDISETAPNGVWFTCYAQSVQVQHIITGTGIPVSTVRYTFERGHMGVHAATFDVKKYQVESETTGLIENEDVTP